MREYGGVNILSVIQDPYIQGSLPSACLPQARDSLWVYLISNNRVGSMKIEPFRLISVKSLVREVVHPGVKSKDDPNLAASILGAYDS